MHEVHEKSRINTNMLFTLLSHKFEKKSNLKNTASLSSQLVLMGFLIYKHCFCHKH